MANKWINIYTGNPNAGKVEYLYQQIQIPLVLPNVQYVANLVLKRAAAQ